MKLIREWLWIIYPVIVGVFIVWGINIVFNEGKWEQLMSLGQEVSQQKAEVAALRLKLGILESVQENDASSKLKRLVEAFPPEKPVWQMVWAIKKTASESASIIKDFKAVVGNVKEATESADAENIVAIDVSYKVDDFGQLVSLLNGLEKKLPIIRVTKMHYGLGLANLKMEGAWKSWQKVTVVTEEPLPEFKRRSEEVAVMISEYGGLTEDERVDLGQVTINPF